jgi:hypothetical protein
MHDVRPPSKQLPADTVLIGHIRVPMRDPTGTMACCALPAELHEDDIAVGHWRLARLMFLAGLAVVSLESLAS